MTLRNKARCDPKADIKEDDANFVIEFGKELVEEIEARLSRKAEENEWN
ncbi:hypothetical protein C5S32_03730 [ANME-1 cluster archaeon GoMg1]|nr:hypothetical protein [ANME-1 cluster archaeon GoMg1]